MYVFILFADNGFYMEPDVEVIGVFDTYEHAFEYKNYLVKVKNLKSYYYITEYKVKKGLIN